MKNIRLIALDMDGTLLSGNGTITARTKQALLRVQQSGIRLVLCSARPAAGITPYARELRMPEHGGYLVAYGGGEIISCAEHTPLFQQAMPPSDLHRVFDIATAHGLHLSTYRADKLYTADDDPYITMEAKNNFLTLVRVADFRREVDFESPKCLLTGEPELVARVFPAAAQACAPRFEAVTSAPFFIEVCPAGVNKRHGMEQVMRAEGLAREQVAAFGDSRNDLPMFQAAGYGIAMGNAVDAVKERAWLVTAGNNEDGIAQVLEKHLL